MAIKIFCDICNQQVTREINKGRASLFMERTSDFSEAFLEYQKSYLKGDKNAKLLPSPLLGVTVEFSATLNDRGDSPSLDLCHACMIRKTIEIIGGKP